MIPVTKTNDRTLLEMGQDKPVKLLDSKEKIDVFRKWIESVDDI